MPHPSAWQANTDPSERVAVAAPTALVAQSARPAAPGRGRLSLIEICGDPGLTPARQRILAAADLIVYERSLAPVIGAVLPTGLYAEPAPPDAPNGPIVERGLRFAFDGWNVVQLVAARSGAARSQWIRQAVEQIAAAGGAADIPALVVVDGALDGPLRIETRLCAAHGVVADRGLTGSLTTMFGPMAHGPAPQVYAFAANGLAG